MIIIIIIIALVSFNKIFLRSVGGDKKVIVRIEIIIRIIKIVHFLYHNRLSFSVFNKSVFLIEFVFWSEKGKHKKDKKIHMPKRKIWKGNRWGSSFLIMERARKKNKCSWRG